MSQLSSPAMQAKLATIQFVSGGCAGFVEVSLMHPLDLIKTRFQIQGGVDDPNRYKSLADCFTRMCRNEGPFSFYKGILAPLLAETPKRATKFFTFEQYKELFKFRRNEATPLTLSMAGLCSGLTEAFVINPFEVVKVKLQAERNISLKEQKSTWHTAKEIIHTRGIGLNGLYLGIPATLGRHGVWNMIYFGFYHTVKDYIPKAENPRVDLVRRFGIGLVAGSLASIINIPFDVAKSRIQGPQPVPGQEKYRHCFRTIALVYKEEGFFALYKGLLPKILRLGPGGAIMLIVYENVSEFLSSTIL